MSGPRRVRLPMAHPPAYNPPLRPTTPEEDPNRDTPKRRRGQRLARELKAAQRKEAREARQAGDPGSRPK